MKNNLVGQAAAGLFPGYFALVMATGIISIAAYLLEMRAIAWILLAVNLIAYPLLWLLLAIRLIWYFPRLLADLTDHGRGPAHRIDQSEAGKRLWIRTASVAAQRTDRSDRWRPLYV